jgi:hypothetical protein
MILEMFDLLLRGQKELSRVLVEQDLFPSIRRMLVLSLLGLLVHSLAVGTAVHYLGAQKGALEPLIYVPFAFIAAFMGTLLICLPSFYFYTQLSGLDASFRLCVAQALRAQATTSVLLLGVLPVYFAVTLAALLGVGIHAAGAIRIGYGLPFIVGLFGLRAVYIGFNDLLEVVPISHPRRGNFVRRMVLCWGALYSVIAPLALWRLIDTFHTWGGSPWA